MTSLFRLLLPAIFLLSNFSLLAQEKIATPKLVIGIVVDQMRYDYIQRYWNKFEDNGFKKLINEGFFCENAHYNYVPTYTAPGHASIYTGTTPSVHGICANAWFEKKNNKVQYCVEDSKYNGVGSEEGGHISPANLMTTTIGDELKLFSNFKSRVISIAIKDRSAVLPGGHRADAAYWLDSKTASWMTSNYYMNSLPEWVKKFNKEKLANQYLSQKWETLLPISEYSESFADDTRYEEIFKGAEKPVFPYDLPKIREKMGMSLIKSTPWGNTLTIQFALRAMEAEQLGKGPSTDMLLISFSSTDYIGHEFGPRSVEVEDTYLRLDRELAEFIAAVEKSAGKENVLIFLTADHGVSDVPAFLTDQKLPGGYYNTEILKDSLNSRFKKNMNHDSVVSAFMNDQVYISYESVRKNTRNFSMINKQAIVFLKRQPGVRDAFGMREVMEDETMEGHTNLDMVRNGYYPHRSGDIVMIIQPGWIDSDSEQGTTHGSGYSYDTHVPLIFYGAGIKAGRSTRKVAISDIVPTICTLLHMSVPAAATGDPIRMKPE